MNLLLIPFSCLKAMDCEVFLMINPLKKKSRFNSGFLGHVKGVIYFKGKGLMHDET